MTREAKDQLTRWSVILGIIVALLAVAAAAQGMADDRYVRKADYIHDVQQIKADIRVIRCQVVKDCQ